MGDGNPLAFEEKDGEVRNEGAKEKRTTIRMGRSSDPETR